jgi:Xaa-Pro dipeptidase
MSYENLNMRGFPIKEFEIRLEKLQVIMKTHEIDAILITTEENFHYFSGINSKFWASPTRPLYMILPAIGNSPIVVIPDLLVSAMTKTWVKEIYSWPAPQPDDDGISLLYEKLAKYHRIGTPMNVETQLRMPLLHLLDLKNRLGKEFIDVSEIIRNLRIIKSEAEVKKIERTCKLTSECFEKLPNHLNSLDIPFITERIAVREMNSLLIGEGLDEIKFIVGTNGNNGYCITDGPTDKMLIPGNIFTIDTGTTFDNYYCDFNRNFLICNNLNKDFEFDFVNHCNKVLYQATEQGFKALKPGNRYSDIFWEILKFLEKSGFGDVKYLNCRFGHCIGLQLTELPGITYYESTILQPGMVLSIEPCLLLPNGKTMVHEECVCITETGYRLLTKRAPITCPTIFVSENNLNGDFRHVMYPLQKTIHISKETEKSINEFHGKQELCKEFHNSISCKATPLYNLPKTQAELGISEILVKDEGKRLGLKSFKALGTLFAVNTLDEKPKTLCTMTDGNHGKAVAYAAKEMNIPAIIYVPNIMSDARISAIKELGAEVVIVNGSYDDAIEEVKHISSKNNWCLVSDTSWDGYTTIPKNIMAGYGTIFREVEEQRADSKVPITHVIIQAGVGGLAAATGAWLEKRRKLCNVWADDVKLVIVEPQDADCFKANVLNQANNKDYHGSLVSCVGKTESIMAGLNCGMPSLIAWPIVRDVADYFITIGDNWARKAMFEMYLQGIVSGETGGAGLAAILAYKDLFSKDDVILTINTEGDTDPENYKKEIKKFQKLSKL